MTTRLRRWVAVASLFATVGVMAGADVGVAFDVAAERRPAVDDTQVALAKLNLLVFLLGNRPETGSNGALDVPCPLLRAEQVTALAGQQQLVADLPAFDAVTVYHDSAIGDGVSGLACGRLDNDTFLAPSNPAAPLRVGLDAFTIDDSATFADALSSVTGGAVVVADVPVIGGELGGRCAAVGTSRHCAWEWHREGLVLGLFTFGPTNLVDEAQSQQLLISMVQPMIDNLLAYEPGDVDTTTTSALPAPTTTLPVVTSVAPTGPTVAPTTPIATTTTLKTFGG